MSSSTPTPRTRPSPWCATMAMRSSKCATTVSAAPIRAAARDCAGSPTASPRSTGGSISSPLRARAHSCGQKFLYDWFLVSVTDTQRPIRVVIAEDSVLLREGLARLLEESGFEVAGQAGDAEDLLRKVGAHKPDVAVVDVRMPPSHTDEGLRAAHQIRSEHPETGVLVLSQYVEEAYALDLLSQSTESTGYLLKDRVADIDTFTDAVRRVASGGSALEPEVVSLLLSRPRRQDPLGALPPPDSPRPCPIARRRPDA